MIDAVLIKNCADSALTPAIVEKFIAAAGSDDPLTVTVRSGNRVVLVPKPTTADAAMNLVRQNIGRNTVRVGITQYPAGLGVFETGELKSDLVDACANLRMGTALFAKVYRVVLAWYGNPTDKGTERQVFEDAIFVWRSGYFEGKAVFRTRESQEATAEEPGDGEQRASANEEARQSTATHSGGKDRRDMPQDHSSDTDPSKASMRVDLSRIGAN